MNTQPEIEIIDLTIDSDSGEKDENGSLDKTHFPSTTRNQIIDLTIDSDPEEKDENGSLDTDSFPSTASEYHNTDTFEEAEKKVNISFQIKRPHSKNEFLSTQPSSIFHSKKKKQDHSEIKASPPHTQVASPVSLYSQKFNEEFGNNIPPSPPWDVEESSEHFQLPILEQKYLTQTVSFSWPVKPSSYAECSHDSFHNNYPRVSTGQQHRNTLETADLLCTSIPPKSFPAERGSPKVPVQNFFTDKAYTGFSPVSFPFKSFPDENVSSKVPVKDLLVGGPYTGFSSVSVPVKISPLKSFPNGQSLPQIPTSDCHSKTTPKDAQFSTSCNTTQDVSIFCLIPKTLKNDIGQRTIDNVILRLIVIEWDIVKLFNLHKRGDFPNLAGTRGEMFNMEVKECYKSFWEYYNVYFSLMLVEFWNDLFIAYGAVIKRRPTICYCVEKIEEDPKRTSYLMYCDAIVRTSDVNNSIVPRDMKVVLVTSISGRQFLGITQNPQRRDFTRPRDATHLTFRINGLSDSELKSKVKLVVQLACSPFVAGDLLTCVPLTSLSGLLKKNNAMIRLEYSKWRSLLLMPQDVGMVRVTSTCNYEDVTAVETYVTERTKPKHRNHNRILIVTDTSPDTLSKIVSRLCRSKAPKLLVCCRRKSFYKTAQLLFSLHFETVVLTRDDKERPRDLAHPLKTKLEENDFDLMSKRTSPKEVLENCQIFLVSIENCHFEDILGKGVRFDVCVVFEANEVTEPLSLVPFSYSVRHFVFLGDTRKYCNVSDLTTKFGFGKSFFQRTYDCKVRMLFEKAVQL